MNRGEFLTRLTIWLALGAYAISAGMLLARRSTHSLAARWWWTFGCALFLAHVACAFSYFHDWSHAAAYRETARQTAEVTGWRWGGGLYLNYLVAVAWLTDALWWWLAPESFARRSPRLNAIWHGFLFFIVFNGTVVFGRGPVRWFGVVICGGLSGLWWRRRHGGIAAPSSDP
jgi:hypothetical protein